MAQKIKPNAFQLGITLPWSSRWFFKPSLKFFVEEDYLIRDIVKKKLSQAGVVSVDIERTGDRIRVNICSSRPGLVIGRGGEGVETLRKAIMAAMQKLRKEKKIPTKCTLGVNIEELNRTEISAAVTAQQIVADIEKRQPYRRIMKRQMETDMQNREAKGVKIRLAGRLNGAEISRREWLTKGRMPLQTLRANIDYAEDSAHCSYGVIGIKVWIYKGDIFEKEAQTSQDRP
jgi:small subunit ribosomal protein S3